MPNLAKTSFGHQGYIHDGAYLLPSHSLIVEQSLLEKIQKKSTPKSYTTSTRLEFKRAQKEYAKAMENGFGYHKRSLAQSTMF